MLRQTNYVTLVGILSICCATRLKFPPDWGEVGQEVLTQEGNFNIVVQNNGQLPDWPAQFVILRGPAVSEDPDVLRDDAPQSVRTWGNTSSVTAKQISIFVQPGGKMDN